MESLQEILKTVMFSILVVGGLGLIAGAVLAFASEKFAVEVDPRVEELEAVLPGINCGACGHPSCVGAAKAIAEGEAPVSACLAGGEAAMLLVAKVMGIEAAETVSRVAKIQCRGDVGKAKLQYEYHGINDCRAAFLLFNGAKECFYGCLALGSCAKACPFGAIEYDFHRVPRVRYDKCTGCGVCVDVCPRGLIDLYSSTDKVFVMCKSHDKGAKVKKVCDVGCVSCGMCERTCPVEAISVQDGLAVVDHSKCVKCGLCERACPADCIQAAPETARAFNTGDCNGCTICAKVCPVNAITGETKQPHEVDPERCIGCGLCVGKCPKDAIEMRERKTALVGPAER